MKKRYGLLLLLLSCVAVAQAHVISYDLDPLPKDQVFVRYLGLGYQHIIPLGLDHILFILCVFFLNNNLKQIVLQASMFTLAHSLTLGLAMYGVIQPPASLIEPLIALSIVLLALENIFSRRVKPWRLVIVFIFGLVHGMGFAGALSGLGMPSYAFATALISFNIGVELGQLTIILLMYFLVARSFAHKNWYRKVIVVPSSLLIALIAGYWTITRIVYAG
ncbi:HupE/UreJ family protein [Taibaiella koreensis]|uniref:HupE/UreJ family protein n=1 Tax=Taibaiella koreensis TaxID=1268548 RepID=UPI0019692E6E|nr:HupE/UreJ family protein [Taibaiella koreensis]